MTTATTNAVTRINRLGERARRSQQELRDAIREEISAARISELAAAKAAGLDRMTIRRLIGKTR